MLQYRLLWRMTTMSRRVTVPFVPRIHHIHTLYDLPDGGLPFRLTKVLAVTQRHKQLRRSRVGAAPCERQHSTRQETTVRQHVRVVNDAALLLPLCIELRGGTNPKLADETLDAPKPATADVRSVKYKTSENS